MWVYRDALETAGLERHHSDFSTGDKEGLILTLSLEGLEGFGQEKRKKDITDQMASCPKAVLRPF